jgi:hypothetical protein
MKQATIEDLIADFKKIANKENVKIPFGLHDGLRAIINALGGPTGAAIWLRDYTTMRHWMEEEEE